MDRKNNKNKKAITIDDCTKDIDFKKVKKSGISAVIFNVSIGIKTYKKNLLKQCKMAKDEGLLVGMCYKFDDKKPANLQGFLLARLIKKMKLDFYPVIEIVSNKSKAAKKEFSDKCLKFMEMINKTLGLECIVKSKVRFSNENLDIRLRKNMFWADECGKEEPDKSTIWSNWNLFNYSSDFIISGIIGAFEICEYKDKAIINCPCDCGHCKDHDKDNPSKPVEPNKPVEPKGCEGLKDTLWKSCIQGDLVKELQYQLNLQFKKGIPVNGCFTEVTKNACIHLRRGAKGDITKIAQKRLIAKGYSVGPSGIDGIYGKDTIKAVKEFQKANKIRANGIVYKDTWLALFKK